MLDEKDLQAIAEIMDSKIGASEKRMAQLMAQQRRDIMQDVKTLLDQKFRRNSICWPKVKRKSCAGCPARTIWTSLTDGWIR